MIIKTKRLKLRNLRKSDAKDIVENINNLNVSKWLILVPYPYTKKDALWWINKTQKESRESPRKNYTFGIELSREKKIIGAIGIDSVNEYQGIGNVGYWIGENYHKKGYGSEALEKILDFAFFKLKLRRIEAGVFAENPSSGKLLEKFGFKQEGLRVKARKSKADGKIKDEILYGLLKEDYRR